MKDCKGAIVTKFAWANIWPVWHEYCKADPITNDIIIPWLISRILGKGPKVSVLDVGTGTGWIANRLLHYCNNVAWMKCVDIDGDLLEVCRLHNESNLARVSFEQADITRGCLPDHWLRGFKADFCFLCFTMLEFSLSDSLIRNIGAALNPSGEVAIILPDVLQDIFETNSKECLEKYIKGVANIRKKSRILGREVPFVANRTETIIHKFLGQGLVLTQFHIEPYVPKEGDKQMHSIFFLLFKKL